MKSLFTRSFILIMALIMVLAFSSVAFAAETDAVATDDLQYVIMTFSEEGTTVETVDELPSTFSSTKNLLNWNQKDVPANSKIGSSVTFDGTGVISIGFAATGAGVGSLNITSNDFNFVAYSMDGQVKTSSGKMSGKQTVNWEIFAAGGSLSQVVLTINALYD